MNKNNYIKPEIVIIELHPEGVIAFSGNGSEDINSVGNATGGASYGKGRSFWD